MNSSKYRSSYTNGELFTIDQARVEEEFIKVKNIPTSSWKESFKIWLDSYYCKPEIYCISYKDRLEVWRYQ